MPSNKELRAGIVEIDAGVDTDGLTNAELSEVLRGLRGNDGGKGLRRKVAGLAADLGQEVDTSGLSNAELSDMLDMLQELKDGPAPAPVQEWEVAEGRALVCRRGVAVHPRRLRAADVNGGAEALGALEARGYVRRV